MPRCLGYAWCVWSWRLMHDCFRVLTGVWCVALSITVCTVACASIQTLTGDHLARYSMKNTVKCVNLVRMARFVYQLLQRKRRSQLRLLIASDSGLKQSIECVTCGDHSLVGVFSWNNSNAWVHSFIWVWYQSSLMICPYSQRWYRRLMRNVCRKNIDVEWLF